MAMSTAPLDIYAYRAALLEWHQEYVGQTQRIYLASDSSALLHAIQDDILRYANLLYNRYATDIDARDLSVLQQHFASRVPQGSHWTHEEIKRLLCDLLQEKQESLARYGRYQSIVGVWYDVLEWVNDLLPGQNYVIISIEDNAPNFVHRLFTKYFLPETIYRRDQAPQDVAWVGKLALLHLGGAWWEQPDGLPFLSQLVEEHNQLFGFY
jgi:hypothetical protein